MYDKIKLSKKDPEVIGKVCIEYFDPLTDKIKHKIEDTNHVFMDSFLCTGWGHILNDVDRIFFFCTDDNTPPTNDFPFLRGNPIAWGHIWQALSGRRGRNHHLILNQLFNDGMSMRFEYGYEWGMNPFPENIGCVGLTTQYRPRIRVSGTTAPESMYLKPVRERPIRSDAWGGEINTTNAKVVKNNIMYTLHQAGQTAASNVNVHIYNLNTRQLRTVNVTGHFNTFGATQERAVGVCFDTNRVFLALHNPTAANRRIIEFADDTFTQVTNTYLMPNLATNFHGRVFAVKNNRILALFNSANLRFIDIGVHQDWQTVPNTPAHFNGTMATSQGMITMKDNLYFYFSTEGAEGRRCPIYDISTMQMIAETGSLFNSQTSNPLGPYEEPETNRGFMFWAPAQHTVTNMDLVTHQALCCFTLSNEDMIRPPNTGIRITYRLEIHY